MKGKKARIGLYKQAGGSLLGMARWGFGGGSTGGPISMGSAQGGAGGRPY